IKLDSQSFKITNDDATQASITQDFITIAGEDYVIRAWCRGSANLAGGTRIADVDGNAALGITATQSGGAANTWFSVEFCIEAPNASARLALKSTSSVNADATYWDKIKILLNLVNNGGMEGTGAGNTLPSGWADQGTPDADETQTDTTTIHSGLASIKLNAAEVGKGVKMSSTATLVVGRWYDFSFWINVSSGTLRVDDNSGNLTATNYTDSGWTRKTFIFKATATTFQGVFKSNTSPTTAYIDDASIGDLSDLDETLNPLASGFHYLPTRDYHGLYIRSGDTLVLSSIVANKDEFGFAIRLQPQFDSAVSTTGEDKTIFMFRFDATNFYRLYYDWSVAKWKLHVEHAGSTFTIESAVQTFSEGDFIELSGRYKGDGTVAAIQIDGTVYTTTTGTAGALASNPTAFHFGYSLDGVTFTEPPNSLIDDFAIFAKAPTADELIAIWTQQTPLENLNSAMVINLALAAGDRFTVDVDAQTFSFYDASVPSETDGGTYLSDRSFPTFTAEPDNRTLLYIPNAIKEIQAVHRPAYL
ncbi:hypothetical protein IH992_14965, partial [Candidatus Poribacteria bacterium]|nr:hypothetical protein [Candidatus Poribacteria bacterium]